MKLRRLAALTLAVCLLLAGCETAAPTGQTPVSPDEQPEDTPSRPVGQTNPTEISYGLAFSAADGWNPYTCLSQENRTIFPLLYEGLFEVAPDFTAEPVLCESFTTSDDLKTYVFRLSPDACFSDGTALTSADIVASFDLARESTCYQGRFKHVASYVATGTNIVTVSLDTACGSLPLLLDVPIIKLGTQERPRPVGSGAYTVQPAPTRLEPSSFWWREDAVPFGGAPVSLRETQDAAEVRDAFELQEISLVCTDATAGSASVYHSDYELWTCPTTVMVYLGFNQQSDVFSNSALRAGITYLVDRETIVTEAFSGFGTAVTLPASPLSACYDRALAAEYDYEPSAFTADVPKIEEPLVLLVNAGDSSRVTAAEQIAAALREAGFSIEVSALAPDEYGKALSNGNYDCYLGEIRLTTDFSLEQFFLPDGSAAYGIGGHEQALAASWKQLENVGNAYDLHRLVMGEGLLCPILFKNYAVYCARGAFADLTAAPYNVFYTAPVEN